MASYDVDLTPRTLSPRDQSSRDGLRGRVSPSEHVAGESRERIHVVARFRPMLQREIDLSVRYPPSELRPTLKFSENQMEVVIDNYLGYQHRYCVDRIFQSSSDQKTLYSDHVRRTVRDVLQGFNGAVIAYGQTGSGKSFTMIGPEGSYLRGGEDKGHSVGGLSGFDGNLPDSYITPLSGVIPRAVFDLFSSISELGKTSVATLRLSYIEIYREVIFDLLAGNDCETSSLSSSVPLESLRLRETPRRGVEVEGLSRHFVADTATVFDLLALGERRRRVAHTAMNAHSSRSHTLLVLELEQRAPDGGSIFGALTLADLAGSEKVGKTRATGETLDEAKTINKSLSALGNVIQALTTSGRTHVPYRDSKLTHLLKESLGGNSKTTLIVTCSCHESNLAETISTLRFAERAKTVQATVHQNTIDSPDKMAALVSILRQDLSDLRRHCSRLERRVAAAEASGVLVKDIQDDSDSNSDNFCVLNQAAEELETVRAALVSLQASSTRDISVLKLDLATAEATEAASRAQIRELSGMMETALADRLSIDEELRRIQKDVLEDRADMMRVMRQHDIEQGRLRQDLNDALDLIKCLRSELHAATQKLTASQRHSLDLEATLSSRSIQISLLESQLASAKESERDLILAAQTAKSQWDDLSVQLKAGQEGMSAMAERVRQSEEAAAAAIDINKKTTSELSGAKREVVVLTGALASMTERQSQYIGETSHLKTQLHRLTEELDIKNADLTTTHNFISSIKLTCEEQHRQISEQQDSISELRALVQDHESERVAMTNDKASLNSAVAKLELALFEQRLAEKHRWRNRSVRPVSTFGGSSILSRLTTKRMIKTILDPEKEGWLYKRGVKNFRESSDSSTLLSQKRWKRRYALLSAGYLYLFVLPSDLEARTIIPLSTCTVSAASDVARNENMSKSPIDTEFYILNIELASRFYQLQVNVEESSEWVTALTQSVMNTPSVDTLPTWVPDHVTDTCSKCHERFSFYKRRHHCRVCGLLFCSTHSSNRLRLPAMGYDTPQRVCDACVGVVSSSVALTSTGLNPFSNVSSDLPLSLSPSPTPSPGRSPPRLACDDDKATDPDVGVGGELVMANIGVSEHCPTEESEMGGARSLTVSPLPVVVNVKMKQDGVFGIFGGIFRGLAMGTTSVARTSSSLQASYSV